MISIKLLRGAAAPKRAHPDDAGLDLQWFPGDDYVALAGSRGFSPSSPFFLKPGERIKLETGICVAIPSGWAGLIRSRSGLADRDGLMVMTGTIDAGYRGEVRVVLYNAGHHTYMLSSGDRIAQLVVVPVLLQVCVVKELSDGGPRGDRGFGSSGTGA